MSKKNEIIESLIQSRLDDVEECVDKQEQVKKVNKEFYGLLEQVKQFVSIELYMQLESAGNGMMGAGIKAGYRIGLAEGFELVQEFKSIASGSVKV